MQVDIAQHRADAATLRRALSRVMHLPGFPNACFQPFVNQAPDHSIAYPSFKYVSQVLMVQRVEELPDIDFQYPAASDFPDRLPEILQSLMW
jgi:hypothetical protein